MPSRIDIPPLSAVTLLTVEAALGWQIYRIIGSFGFDPDNPLPTFVAAYVAIRVFLSLVHELGHVAAGRILGMDWTHFKVHTFGLSVAVETPDGAARTASDQLLISVSGPVTGVTASFILLTASTLPDIPTAMIAAPALLTIAGEVLYFTIVAPLFGDGNKAARALAMIVAGRRTEPFGV